MLSLEEISDRLQIQQLLVDYSTAIDQRRFDDLDRVFTPTLISTFRLPERSSNMAWLRHESRRQP